MYKYNTGTAGFTGQIHRISLKSELSGVFLYLYRIVLFLPIVRKHKVFIMDMKKFAPSKRMVIATTMACIVAIVMIASYVWGPAA